MAACIRLLQLTGLVWVCALPKLPQVGRKSWFINKQGGLLEGTSQSNSIILIQLHVQLRCSIAPWWSVLNKYYRLPYDLWENRELPTDRSMSRYCLQPETRDLCSPWCSTSTARLHTRWLQRLPPGDGRRSGTRERPSMVGGGVPPASATRVGARSTFTTGSWRRRRGHPYCDVTGNVVLFIHRVMWFSLYTGSCGFVYIPGQCDPVYKQDTGSCGFIYIMGHVVLFIHMSHCFVYTQGHMVLFIHKIIWFCLYICHISFVYTQITWFCLYSNHMVFSIHRVTWFCLWTSLFAELLCELREE